MFRRLFRISICFFIISCSTVNKEAAAQREPVVFKEVWGYMLPGDESKLKAEVFTDICLFGAAINYAGKLSVPKYPSIKNNVKIHLVVAELSNQALMHFCMSRDLPLREVLIKDIVEASKDYNGVQIDFENLKSDDKDLFLDFLSELKTRLGKEKMLSVAVPARIKERNDAYNYSALAGTADRIIVMAYDEHWSGSAPGAVASFAWCKDVADYASRQIPQEKFIMGLPLYSRSWQDKKLARAMTHKQLNDMFEKYKPEIQKNNDNDLFFTFNETVTVSVYYDSIDTVLEKMKLYKSAGAAGVSFWRIGYEMPDLWNYVGAAK